MNIIIDLQNSDTWKIQLTISINFIFLKDVEQDRVMHSRRDNIKFTSYNDVNTKLLMNSLSHFDLNFKEI